MGRDPEPSSLSPRLSFLRSSAAYVTVSVLAFVLIVLSLAGSGSAAGGLTIRVQGNRLVDGNGHTVRLLGVNRSSLEYACAQGWGMWTGPIDRASIAAMKTWRINAVRLPLNEACWLGLRNVKPEYRAGPYRRAVLAYVQRLHAAGLYVIIDLHWKAAGMQQLVNAVRSTGSKHPLLLGGLRWANDLSGWLRWRPRDPARQLVASVHVYETNACGDRTCWNDVIGKVAKQVPVVSGEIAQASCAHDFIDSYMSWADALGVSYLAWAWVVWGCRSE